MAAAPGAQLAFLPTPLYITAIIKYYLNSSMGLAG